MQATEVKVDNHMKQELPADENTPIPVVFSHDDPANPQAWASSKRWRGEFLPAALKRLGSKAEALPYPALLVALTVSYTSACKLSSLPPSLGYRF